MISQKNKGRLVLIVIALMFFIPILLSWYLSFFSDFKKDAQGIQHGILIEPPIPLGNLQAFSIGETNIDELQKKWTIVFFTGKSGKQDSQNKLYQLRQIRLAVGKDRDKVERLLIADKSLDWEKFKDDYKDQKVIDDRSKSYNSLIKLFKQYDGFDMSSIYLIDAYGSLIMKYQKDAKPKGIIKDIERLIRVAP